MRRATPIVLNDEERETLTALARSRTEPVRQVTRAKIVLAAAGGAENQDIADELGQARGTVRTWRNRFAEQRLAGIERERDGRGRKPHKRQRWARTIVEVTPRQLSQRGGVGARDLRLHRFTQRGAAAVRLDRQFEGHSAEDRASTSSSRYDQESMRHYTSYRPSWQRQNGQDCQTEGPKS
jgi:transposase